MCDSINLSELANIKGLCVVRFCLRWYVRQLAVLLRPRNMRACVWVSSVLCDLLKRCNKPFPHRSPGNMIPKRLEGIFGTLYDFCEGWTWMKSCLTSTVAFAACTKRVFITLTTNPQEGSWHGIFMPGLQVNLCCLGFGELGMRCRLPADTYRLLLVPSPSSRRTHVSKMHLPALHVLLFRVAGLIHA